MKKVLYFLLNKPFCNHFGTVFDLGLDSEEVLEDVFVAGVLDCKGAAVVNSCLMSRYSCFKSLLPTQSYTHYK